MDDILYSVKETSEKLELHEKTVLRFLKEGKLTGIKVGRSWKIKKSAVDQLLGFEPSANANEIDMTVELPREGGSSSMKVQVSSVVDIFVDSYAEADRISTMIVATLNCKDASYGESSYKFLYYEEEKKARLLLWGSALFMEKMLGMISMFTEERRG